MVESGGLSPEEVELQVARPIELALGGAPGVERVRSQSAPGLAIIWAEFAWSTDLQVDRQQVVERLSSLEGALPEGVRPALGPQSSIMGEILLVGLSSADGAVEGPRLRDLAEVLRPRLTAVPGVSQVIALGGGVDQLQVEPDPARLAQLRVSLGQVAAAVQAAQGSTAGGFVDRGEQEWVVRSLARTTDPERIGWSPVPVEGGWCRCRRWRGCGGPRVLSAETRGSTARRG
jgi:HME family heavy-metal exporter